MEIQTIAAILFILFLTIFLVLKRKQIVVQKILFPVLYFAMYRTNWGLTAMDKTAKRFKSPLKYMSLIGVGIGFLGMGLIAFELIFNIYRMLTQPGGMPGVGVIQPFAPHIPGTIFVPFFYFIISIFIIATIHEFSHGVIARLHNLKVKSSGFAFLGIVFPILPAAFVEPDERQVRRKTTLQQLSIYAAGPFSNIIVAFVILGIFFLAVAPIGQSMLEVKGAFITDLTEDSPASKAGMKTGELITQIDGESLSDTSALNKLINAHSPGESAVIVTDESVYRVVLEETPIRASLLERMFSNFGYKIEDKKIDKPYLGIMAKHNTLVKESFTAKYGSFIPKVISWFIGLFQWLFILNLGIGLFNLVPLGPIDGGRMLKTVLDRKFEKEKALKVFSFVSLVCLSALFINIFLAIVG